MAVPDRVKAAMKRLGLKGVNKPKRTPDHATKSHVVMASEGGSIKLFVLVSRVHLQQVNLSLVNLVK